jgi:hypothetical protein
MNRGETRMGRKANQPILVWFGLKNQFDFAFEVINVKFFLLVAHEYWRCA